MCRGFAHCFVGSVVSELRVRVRARDDRIDNRVKDFMKMGGSEEMPTTHKPPFTLAFVFLSGKHSTLSLPLWLSHVRYSCTVLHDCHGTRVLSCTSLRTATIFASFALIELLLPISDLNPHERSSSID